MGYNLPLGNILCRSCGTMLGKKYKLFYMIHKIRQIRRAKSISDLNRMMLQPEEEPVGPLLDALEIKNECCRVHCMSVFSPDISY